MKVDTSWGLRDREALGFWLVELGGKEYQMGKRPWKWNKLVQKTVRSSSMQFWSYQIWSHPTGVLETHRSGVRRAVCTRNTNLGDSWGLSLKTWVSMESSRAHVQVRREGPGSAARGVCWNLWETTRRAVAVCSPLHWMLLRNQKPKNRSGVQWSGCYCGWFWQDDENQRPDGKDWVVSK